MRQKYLLPILIVVLGWVGLCANDCCDSQFVPFDPCCYSESNCCAESTFYLYGDWLYWRLRRCGLDYILPVGEGDASISSGNYRSIPLKYENGFRIGGGFRDYCKQIEVGVRYTSYDFKRNDTFVDPTVTSYATRPSPQFAALVSGNNDVGFASAKYKLDYDTIDLYVGSYIELDCDSWIVPFIGARLAFIDERLKTIYADAVNVELANQTGNIIETSDLNAYGLIMGFDLHKSLWNCCVDISFYSRALGSVMLGEFDIAHMERVVVNPFPFEFTNINSRCLQLVSAYELAAGFEIGLFECCEYSLALQVGYEFNGWCNYADFIHIVDNDLPTALMRNMEGFGTDGLYFRVVGTY